MHLTNHQELSFYIHDQTSFRVEIRGYLCADNAGSVTQAMHTAKSTIGDRPVTVEIDGLTGIDLFGCALLREWHEGGARIIAKSPSARVLAASITGESVTTEAGTAKRKSRIPRLLVRLMPIMVLICPATAMGANLEPKTWTAWERYVEAAQVRMDQRLTPAKTFLWVDESPERLASVRSGEVVVSPAAAHSPMRVPDGLVHDWIGAVFVPGVQLADVLDVVRDFASYKDVYKPTVIDSKVISSTDAGGRFSMLLLNRSLLAKTAVDTEYQSRCVLFDGDRGYITSRTTRVQEIEDYGAPDQHLLQQGEGTGFIWSLFSTTRFLQRDGGVYIELEAIALSRDIPTAVRWMIEPLVRRVARSALSVTLQQTEKAVTLHEASLSIEQRRHPGVGNALR